MKNILFLTSILLCAPLLLASKLPLPPITMETLNGEWVGFNYTTVYRFSYEKKGTGILAVSFAGGVPSLYTEESIEIKDGKIFIFLKGKDGSRGFKARLEGSGVAGKNSGTMKVEVFFPDAKNGSVFNKTMVELHKPNNIEILLSGSKQTEQAIRALQQEK